MVGTKTAITHRIGRLGITDIAVVIATSTPHRAESYEANRYAIERIKEIVPIWKKEHWEDGEKWIGDQLETKEYLEGKPGRKIWMIKVMFFAHLREQIGTGEIEINSFKGTVKELKEYLQINHSLNNLDSIMTAVNEEFCHDETMVDEGDIIALIPPVSGG